MSYASGYQQESINIGSGDPENQNWKKEARVATVVAGVLATDFEAGDVVDGIALAEDDRLLIKNQAAPAENGIYVVGAAGSGAPTRAEDSDDGEKLVGAVAIVLEGATNADTAWIQTTDPPITIDVSPIVWIRWPQLPAAQIVDTDADTSVSVEQPIGTDTDITLFTNGGTVSGRFTATNDFEADFNINLPIVATGPDQGQYQISGDRVVHVGPSAADLSYYSGRNSGNLGSAGATENVGVGNLALAAVTTGSNNTMVGSLAGNGLEDGSRNTAIGRNSGLLLVDGSENTFLGADAGATIGGGSSNVLLGHTAGSALGAGATNELAIQNSVGALIEGNFSTGALGFRGSIPTTKPSIVGSRGGNAALASLLSALDAMGLITDSTTP